MMRHGNQTKVGQSWQAPEPQSALSWQRHLIVLKRARRTQGSWKNGASWWSGAWRATWPWLLSYVGGSFSEWVCLVYSENVVVWASDVRVSKNTRAVVRGERGFAAAVGWLVDKWCEEWISMRKTIMDEVILHQSQDNPVWNQYVEIHIISWK